MDSESGLRYSTCTSPERNNRPLSSCSRVMGDAGPASCASVDVVSLTLVPEPGPMPPIERAESLGSCCCCCCCCVCCCWAAGAVVEAACLPLAAACCAASRLARMLSDSAILGGIIMVAGGGELGPSISSSSAAEELEDALRDEVLCVMFVAQIANTSSCQALHARVREQRAATTSNLALIVWTSWKRRACERVYNDERRSVAIRRLNLFCTVCIAPTIGLRSRCTYKTILRMSAQLDWVA